ncbi:cystein proteinase inhibitor protein salarin-like [Engraulis encrasicolus]|uniref:cystein proteinase inhibitor protein salarin-like n=1 Tax=Engraulis encrasicolus TaxID=184585 RepID=UPI002FD319B5
MEKKTKMASNNDDAAIDKEFQDWKVEYGRHYRDAEEEAMRKAIWLKTRDRVLAHNARAEQGLETWKMGLNNFSDMRPEEMPKKGLILPDKPDNHS